VSDTLLLPEHLENYFIDGSSCEIFINPQHVYPATYLDYARADESTKEGSRSQINAIGNAKRAFHLQAELLCNAFGWPHLVPKPRNNFGARLDFLSRCGVLSPKILRKLNATRNHVEHDYTTPAAEQVSDYIDIVELFLMATKSLLDRFPSNLDFTLMRDEYYDQKLHLPDTVRTSITMGNGGVSINYSGRIKSFGLSDEDYFNWIFAITRQYVL